MNKGRKEPEAGQKPDQPFFPEHMHITTGEKGWSAAQFTYCHPVRGYTPLGMQLVSWSPQTGYRCRKNTYNWLFYTPSIPLPDPSFAVTNTILNLKNKK